MICLAYENGVLVEKTGEPWGRRAIQQYAESTAAEREALSEHLMRPRMLSHRERRRLARCGRKFPKRVPAYRQLNPFFCARRIEVLVGHRIRRETPFSGPYAPRVPEDFILYIREDDSIDDPRHIVALTAYTDALYDRILRSHR